LAEELCLVEMSTVSLLCAQECSFSTMFYTDCLRAYLKDFFPNEYTHLVEVFDCDERTWIVLLAEQLAQQKKSSFKRFKRLVGDVESFVLVCMIQVAVIMLPVSCYSLHHIANFSMTKYIYSCSKFLSKFILLRLKILRSIIARALKI